jgi:hypothetical protein
VPPDRFRAQTEYAPADQQRSPSSKGPYCAHKCDPSQWQFWARCQSQHFSFTAQTRSDTRMGHRPHRKAQGAQPSGPKWRRTSSFVRSTSGNSRAKAANRSTASSPVIPSSPSSSISRKTSLASIPQASATNLLTRCTTSSAGSDTSRARWATTSRLFRQLLATLPTAIIAMTAPTVSAVPSISICPQRLPHLVEQLPRSVAVAPGIDVIPVDAIVLHGNDVSRVLNIPVSPANEEPT